jgi:hypothetical protein
MRLATILRSARGRRVAVLAVALGLVGLVAPTAAFGGGTGPVTNYLEYTLGTKGKANKSLKAITIGFVNIEGGPFPCCPEATKGARAAVNYVNAALGGVGGHPVKLKTCFIRQAEEEGQRCGQLMANDKNVSVIVFGGVFVGNQSFYGVLKGKKPVIIGVSASPVDGNQKNVFALLGDQPHVLGPGERSPGIRSRRRRPQSSTRTSQGQFRPRTRRRRGSRTPVSRSPRSDSTRT